MIFSINVCYSIRLLLQGPPGKSGPQGLDGFRGIKGHVGPKGYEGGFGEKGDRVNNYCVAFQYIDIHKLSERSSKLKLTTTRN